MRTRDAAFTELREEKHETTFLDEIHLESDEASWAPEECNLYPSLCAADGSRHILREGETLRLTFAVNGVEHADPMHLWAAGFYVPTEGEAEQ